MFKQRASRIAVAMMAATALTTPVLADEDLASWSKYKVITLNTKASGAGVAANVANFPLLVRLDESNAADVFAGALTGGADLRFATQDGSLRPFEIEHWDEVNKKAAIWVLVDSVKGNDSIAALRLYWGNSNATNASGNEVFAAGQGYVGVWGLSRGTGSERAPSVAGAPNAIVRNGLPQVQGVIGLADTLSPITPASGLNNGRNPAAGRYIELGRNLAYEPNNYSGFSDFSNGIYYSLWVNPSACNANAFHRLLVAAADSAASAANNNANVLFMSSSGTAGCNLALRGIGDNYNSTSAFSANQWSHLAFSRATGTGDVAIYVNGALFATAPANSAFTTLTAPAFRNFVFVGRSTWGDPETEGPTTNGNPYFQGKVDQITLAKQGRSAEFVKLSYETQKANAATVILGATQSQSSGPYADWSSRKDIVLNTSASGANVTGDVYNFPVLVRLGANESSILSAAKAGGADIRFARGNTALPYEIESWSNTAAAIWVKVDTIKGNNSTQKITMYWGKNDASSESNGAAVFDTANGYRAVFHMNEETGNIHDATANDITGTNIGTTTTPGNIGAGRKFAGTNALNSNSSTDRQYIELGNPSALNFAGRITMSSWVRWLNVAPTGQGGTHYRTIINRDGSSPSTETFLRIGHSSGNASQAPYATGKYAAPDIFAQSPQLASAYPDSAVWIHLVGTYDSTGPTERIWRLYRNGVQIATSTDHASAALTTGASMWRLGQGPGNNQTRYFSGDLDEVRIDAVTRDSNYIKLSYENQKATNTLTNVGLPPAPAGIYDGWSKSKEITLNTTASGANVAGEVRNFPVLIRLGSAESTILSEAKAGGADIRFARGDIALPYEIESWSTTAAAIWVKVDTIKGNNATQKITMYWGKNDANSESNGPAVFDSANGFVAVWHMGGAAAAEVNAVGDAGLNAAVTGTLPSQDGLIGKARSYAGTTENYLSVPNSASGKLNFPASADYTLSAWVFSEETTLDNRGILNKGNDQWLIGVYGGSEDKFYDLMTRGNGTWNQAATETITTATGVGVWRHVVGVWKGSGTPQDTGRIYIDGALATTSAFNDLEFDGRDTTANVYIGVLWENGGLARPYHGRIDEVIVSNVFRDSNWVKLAFESQKLTQKFTNIGVTQAPAATAPGAPQSLTAVVSATQQGTVTLTWTAPLNNGGAAITAYTVTAAPSNKTCATTGALTCSITELPAGTHTFTVTATNSAGTSAVSNTASATITALLPGAFAIHMDGSHKPYTFRLPTAAIATTEKLSMTITNIQGKQVWSQTVNPASSKVGEITWNGRTLKGQPVAPGMYIVRLRAEMAGQTLEAVRGSVKQ